MHSQSLLKCWNKKQRVFCNNFSSIRVCEFRTSMVKVIKFLEDDVFIGVNVIICNSVTIGKGSIVGAGSVVTKDIPPYQVWAGNPAKFIKDREH